MPIERWQSLTTFELPRPPQPQPPQVQAPQPQPLQPPPLRMTGPWLRVADLLPAKRIIKIMASGTWSDLRPAEDPVGPDGYLDLTLPADQLVVSNAPTGALLGKIGGSTADRITGDKTKDGIVIFPIGTFCVVAPFDKAAPLFVAVNGAQSLAEFSFLTLKVEISTSEP